jgi:integrase
VQSKKSPFPAPVHHKPRDQDVLFLRDASGKRRMVYLGKHGSPEAARRYREVLSAHLAGQPLPAASSDSTASFWPTIAQLVAGFLVHADRYYRDAEGRISREVTNYRLALRFLLRFHRDTPTDRFSVTDLSRIRDAIVDEEFGQRIDARGRPVPGTGKRRCRNYVNACVRRIKQVLRWGTTQRLVPGGVWHELSALSGLTIGRSGVRESKPVEAVPWSLVEATLPHLTPTVRAAVLVQWHSGMRAAEVLAMTRRQLDTSGPQWIYRPVRHKGSWKGRERIVALGPNAQEALRPFVTLDPDAAIFSPSTSWDEFRDEKRRKRRTAPTRQMQQRDARAAEPEFCDFFDVSTYRRAIHRACDRAEVPRWSPHRLRHAAGTRLVLKEGIEAARAALGHADARMTRRYSTAADADLAVAVAARHG